MPEGAIAKYFPLRGFGFIRPDAGGKDVYFRAQSVRGIEERDLKEGLRVTFETETSPQGPRARFVHPAGTGVSTTPVRQPSGGYRFLNPYNFVRSLRARNAQNAPLMGRCAPPPHDRYVGLTGRICCTLTATTPLFVADPEDVQEQKGHYSFRFFRYGDMPAIPATSLRGSIRSAFEAATNSCFSVFSAKKRLSYHLQPEEALKLVPARVVQKGAEWILELLPGATSLAVGQKPQGPQYAAWVHCYRPLQASRTVRDAPNTPYGQRKTLSLADWRHGQECQAIIEEMEHPRRHFHFWNVVQLARCDAPPLKPGPGQKRIIGYLCITNQNIENKHDERLFFADGKPTHVKLETKARDRYGELIADYQERHQDAVAKRVRPEVPHGQELTFSWFVIDRKGNTAKLCDGDLVYAMLRRDGESIQVEFIVPVSVPRVGYDQSVGERLDPGNKPQDSLLHKCCAYSALCPACRVFGWVSDEAPADLAVPVAYAGRVRFSHGKLTYSAGTFNATLAILSSPKPTTTRFYLKPADDKEPLRDGQEDQQVDYSIRANCRLRGRKFYRHHGDQLSRQDYERADNQRDDQNRSVREVQGAGSTFEFTVEFENLAAVELGALLWTLEMDGWNHRLGMGKPLGFGSAKIGVTGLEILDTAARYSGLDPAWEPSLDRKATFVRQFHKAMEARYGREFHQLENIRDLRALLAESPKLPVHYPRPTQEPQAEGRNYEWFMGNKRSGREAGPRLVLRLAEEDTQGLPLIDKYGQT